MTGFTKITTFLKKSKAIIIILFSFILILFVSIIRYYFGPELSFTLFYFFPLFFVTWKTGIWAGIFLSFSSALLWLIIDIGQPNQFSNDIIPYLNSIFRLIVFLIMTYMVSELKIALEKQKELARIDPLTSIANRRAFYETANIEIEKARRHGFPISILCMDLDNFKEVNDTLGHSIGDLLLKLVARILFNNIRAIDLAGRLGGDEFGILLPQTSAESAYIVASKLKDKIIEVMQNNNWTVTPSIGIITSLNAYESIDEMIKKADILMYSAKHHGKNIIKQSIIPV